MIAEGGELGMEDIQTQLAEQSQVLSDIQETLESLENMLQQLLDRQ